MNHVSASDLVAAASALAAVQNLRGRAFEGYEVCVRACAEEGPDGLISGWAIEEVEPHFVSCSLVFEHGLRIYPFVDTRLELCARDKSGFYFRDLRPIGYYRPITLLDGTDDDDFVIDVPKPNNR